MKWMLKYFVLHAKYEILVDRVKSDVFNRLMSSLDNEETIKDYQQYIKSLKKTIGGLHSELRKERKKKK